MIEHYFLREYSDIQSFNSWLNAQETVVFVLFLMMVYLVFLEGCNFFRKISYEAQLELQ